MRFGERVFYTSENGDRWMLVTDDDIVSVRHIPNAASGGAGRTIELGAFLDIRTPFGRKPSTESADLIPHALGN